MIPCVMDNGSTNLWDLFSINSLNNNGRKNDKEIPATYSRGTSPAKFMKCHPMPPRLVLQPSRPEVGATTLDAVQGTKVPGGDVT